MFKFRCKLCDHEVKVSGSYAGHAELRKHMKLAHPNDFAVLVAGEQRIEQIRSQLGEQFGLALRPRNMNPDYAAG